MDPGVPPQARLQSHLRQISCFACVGVAATATHYGVARIAHDVFGAAPLWANLFGYVAAVSISYLGHSVLTFRRPVLDHAQAARFATVSLAGLGLSQLITIVGTRLAHISFSITLLAVVTVVPVSTFFASRLWAFAGGAGPKAVQAAAGAGPRDRGCSSESRQV